MKFKSTLFSLIVFCLSANAQTPVTAVSINPVTTTGSTTYVSGANTYNWSLSPNNTTAYLTGFTAGGISYSYASISGNVKLRRVNNPNISGNFTLVWAEGFLSGSTFNMLPQYENDMELYFNNQVYNKGTDNFFDNIAANGNNIERLDFILTGSYSTPLPAEVGFPVFERGDAGNHDPFVIAAITSLDGSGNPTSYGNIVRVKDVNYGEPGPNVTFRILKAPYPSNLVDAGSNTQTRGGVFISLQDLGIAANQVIYGYSVLGNDLPMSATPANLVDYTNTTFYPNNTGFSGGIDMVAVTGIYATTTSLPTRFTGFNAIENSGYINLKWSVENENTVDHYEIERSIDGINFMSVQLIKGTNTSVGTKSYSVLDNVSSITSNVLYYRIKQYDHDGSFYYSKTVAVRKNKNNSAILIYPNPVKQHLYINFKSSSDNKAIVTVINAAGKKLLIQKENLFDGTNSITVEGVERLSKGVYFISINVDSGKTFTKKFTKE